MTYEKLLSCCKRQTLVKYKEDLFFVSDIKKNGVYLSSLRDINYEVIVTDISLISIMKIYHKEIANNENIQRLFDRF